MRCKILTYNKIFICATKIFDNNDDENDKDVLYLEMNKCRLFFSFVLAFGAVYHSFSCEVFINNLLKNSET